MTRPMIVALLAAVAIIALVCWRKAAAKAKQDREQADRKRKEDALDRALSNASRPSGSAQVPMQVHYSAHAQKAGGAMLRLTEQAESVTKEYLFQQAEVFYIGEEYGRAAVFRETSGNTVHCELFPYQGGTYVRLCGSAACRLIRGKETAHITEKAIRLRTGDRIETKAGVFLVEIL